MKKFYLVVLLITLVISTAFSQTPDGQTTKTVSPEAEKASIEVVKLFKQQKYDAALPFAQKAVELNLRELGAEHLKTAQAYVNLGYVQRGRDKRKEAVAAFESAVTIFEKKPNLPKVESLTLAQVLESLGYLQFDAGKEGGSEKYYKRALELREKFNGAESKETADTLWSLGNLNSSVGDYPQAAEYYRRVYEIRLKKVGANDFETSDALERSVCTLSKADKRSEAESLREQFKTLRNDHNLPDTYSGKTIQGGVINGKAIKLQQPPYPDAAKKDNAEGQVNVQVVIDETGKVIYACGGENKAHPSLIEAAEWAAYNSKFTPTSLGGKPVKVTGVIVFKFIR